MCRLGTATPSISRSWVAENTTQALACRHTAWRACQHTAVKERRLYEHEVLCDTTKIGQRRR